MSFLQATAIDTNAELDPGPGGSAAQSASESSSGGSPSAQGSSPDSTLLDTGRVGAPDAGASACDAADKPDRIDLLSKLALIPFAEVKRDVPPPGSNAHASRWFDAASVGVWLTPLLLIAVGAVYDHSRQATLLADSARETGSLASTVNALKVRLDVIEAPRAREDTADLKKAAGEIKAEASATRDLSASLALLTARLDRVERDHAARMDKLGERIDHESTARLADITARLDKLERKAAPPVTIPGSPVPPAAPKQALLPARGDFSGPNDMTGSIEKPKPLLRGYSLEDVRDGFAVVGSRDGQRSVAPGDFIPGAGRVLRIERHGRDWVVITSLGVIASDPPPY